MSEQSNTYQVKSIRVEKLFGHYDYQLPAEGESLGDVGIIYGQNGAGKTTLLTLAFHLLSPASNAGHRTKITEVPFQYLEVVLQDGSRVSARKDPQLLIGPCQFTIARPSGEKFTLRVPEPPSTISVENISASIDIEKLPREMRAEVERALERQRFYVQLKDLESIVLMLTSDRILLGDSVKDAPKPFEPRAEAMSQELLNA